MTAAGPDQAGRPVPAVYAVSRPQPLEGVIMIGRQWRCGISYRRHSTAATRRCGQHVKVRGSFEPCLYIVESPLASSARVGDVERLVLWLKRPVHHHAGMDRERLDNGTGRLASTPSGKRRLAGEACTAADSR